MTDEQRRRVSIARGGSGVTLTAAAETSRRYKQRHPGKYLLDGRAAAKKARTEHPERFRRYSRLKLYGLTHGQLLELLAAQHGVCAICSEQMTEATLHVDHDHNTGAVRGLLCPKCNAALGFLSDSPARLRAALVYLEQRSA